MIHLFYCQSCNKYMSKAVADVVLLAEEIYILPEKGDFYFYDHNPSLPLDKPMAFRCEKGHMMLVEKLEQCPEHEWTMYINFMGEANYKECNLCGVEEYL